MAKSIGDSLRNNLETIREQLLDEQKLISYITVANDLCIHVNEAKKILTQVLQDVRKKQPATMHFNVNYIISGLSGNNSAKTIICSEPELDTNKSSFNIVWYHHIYSIGLGKESVDNAALVSLNRFEDFPFCPGLIKSSVCSKRTSEDTDSLKLKCQVQKNETETKQLPLKIEKIANADDKIVKIKAEVISPKKETSNGSINKTNGNKPKSIAGFFTKSNNAPSTKSNKTEDSQKQALKTDNKGLSSFLTKSNSAPNAKPNQTVKEIKDEKMEIDVETTEDTSKKPIKKESNSSLKKKSKSLSEIKKNGKIDKKRKRVLQVSDSDSDNDPFSNEKPNDPESEDEIPPTPATNTVKFTLGILNPKKRRKIVDKTYTDEEGYILTRKEEIYESCSEEEAVSETAVKVEKENLQEAIKLKTEDSPKDKKGNKASKKKISPPQKGKQVTMMNFFKKI